MRFDDRLLTVLNQPASDRHDAAVRWRQLVDLVARAGPNSASPVVAQALDSIRSERENVEEALRAAAARAIAALPLPFGLLECFASDRLAVAAPILAAASLEPAQWRALHAVGDDETRRFIETLHPEVTVPAPTADLTESLVEPAPPTEFEAPQPAPLTPSLSEVVARIERRRALREQRAPSIAVEGGPQGACPLFRWECGASGEIVWVEGAPRGPLVGRSIARAQELEGDRVDDEVVRAFAMRAPFRDATMTLAGDTSVSGDWKISGVPAFDPTDGRFAGYRGIALREVPAPAALDHSDVLADPDALRELVHEIKTPLNAIIGFAEIIDGQFLGPADRRYRERAAEIVTQARLLLGAIDDLDFAAKVHSASGGTGRKVDLAELLDRVAEQLRGLATERGIELEIAGARHGFPAAVEPELADRLIFRLCAALFDAAEPRERLRLSVEQHGDQRRFSVSRPSRLRGVSDRELIESGTSEQATGFSLRLVRGLARIAGGDLITAPAGLSLLFPSA